MNSSPDLDGAIRLHGGTAPGVAVLLSTPSFEEFYEETLGFSIETFIAQYRNEWSWEYLRALELGGWRPYLYVASERHSGLYETADGFRIRFVRLGRANHRLRQTRRLRRGPALRYLWNAANAVALLDPLRQAAREDELEAVLVQEYWPARIDVLSGRLPLKVVGVDQGYPDSGDIKLFKRWSLGKLHAIVVQTETESSKVSRFGGTPLQLPNGVDTARFAPAPVARSRRLLVVVARLADDHKRISDAIKAMRTLSEDWNLVIYGDGPDATMLHALAADIGVADRVAFRGFAMDRSPVIADLQRCTAVVLPSAYEGLPMALLEGMACGAPALASDIPSIGVVVRNGTDGVLVPVGAPEAIAQGAVTISENLDEMSSSARSRVVDSFSLESLGRQLVAVLNE